MNPYLSPQKNEKKRFEIPLLVFYILMFVSSCTVVKDYKESKSIFIGMVLIGLFAWGILRIVNRRIACAKAKHYAEQLALLTEEHISFSKLDSILPKSQGVIDSLIKHGYLQNMYLDREQKRLCLTAANKHVQSGAYFKALCPGCGATKLVQRGRVSQCDYCGQVLAQTAAPAKRTRRK